MAEKITRCAWRGIVPERRCGECKAGHPENCVRARQLPALDDVFSTNLGSPLEWRPQPKSLVQAYTELIINGFAGPDEDFSAYDRLHAFGPYLASNS